MNYRENTLRTLRCEPNEWIPNFFTDKNLIVSSCMRDYVLGPAGTKDWFGVEWTDRIPTPGTRRLSDITAWREEIEFPDLDAIDWESAAERDLAGTNPELINNISIAYLLFERLHAFVGFEDALTYLLTEPEATMEFFTALTDFRCREIEKIGKHYKPDLLTGLDDWGYEKGMFMSLPVWREMIKPHMARIVQCVHDNGMLYEHHSCGYIQPLVGDLVEIGVDALDPVQGKNDIFELHRQYGDRLCLIGGFDNQRILDQQTPDEDAVLELRRVLEPMRGETGYGMFWVCQRMDRAQLATDILNELNADAMRRAGVTPMPMPAMP